jgi:hypothetical protein
MPITKFQGAKILEQGVTFAIVVVQPRILNACNKTEANRTAAIFQSRIFPGIPVILMAQDPFTQVPQYYGRKDIVHFLAGIPVQSIPWQEFTINE